MRELYASARIRFERANRKLSETKRKQIRKINKIGNKQIGNIRIFKNLLGNRKKEKMMYLA